MLDPAWLITGLATTVAALASLVNYLYKSRINSQDAEIKALREGNRALEEENKRQQALMVLAIASQEGAERMPEELARILRGG